MYSQNGFFQCFMKMEYNLIFYMNMNSWSLICVNLVTDLCPGVCGRRRSGGRRQNCISDPKMSHRFADVFLQLHLHLPFILSIQSVFI